MATQYVQVWFVSKCAFGGADANEQLGSENA